MLSFQVVACVALECLHITNTNTSGCLSTVKHSRLCETKDVVQILESGIKATTPHQPGVWSWMKKGQSQATGSVLGAVLVERQEGRQPIKKPTPQSFSARTKLWAQPSSAQHNTLVSLWRTVLCRWYAGERLSAVVDLQSAGCPTVTPRYCCWPFICHSCVSQHLERSSWRHHVCHIFTDISAKTESTFILTILPGHYFVTVSVVHYSWPCSYFYKGHYEQFILSSDQLRAASLIGRNAVTWLCALSTVRRA